MICDSPYYVMPKAALEKVPVPCGRCPVCKKKRVDHWVFRLTEHMKVCDDYLFITLTYDTRNVPISDNGFMTLSKADFQNFMKRLRVNTRLPNIKYYACGEYGSKTERPHFHAILFGVRDAESIKNAWSLDGQLIGNIHVGKVTQDSMAYVMKYIDKSTGNGPKHYRDDRVREFSLMSKGLGKNYLSDDMKKYHQEDLRRMYVVRPGGSKLSMPRYYRSKIYTDEQLRKQLEIIEEVIVKQEELDKREFNELYGGNPSIDYETWQTSKKYGRYKAFYANQKHRNI